MASVQLRMEKRRPSRRSSLSALILLPSLLRIPPSLNNLQQPRRDSNNSPKQGCNRTKDGSVRESIISFGDKSYPSASSSTKEKALPPQMTGPNVCNRAVQDHNIPNLIPNSLVGEILAQLAATSANQAPLAIPYVKIPMTTTASGNGTPVQKAIKTFHTPNASAMNPEAPRPMNEPA
jgi:hypothetical protein